MTDEKTGFGITPQRDIIGELIGKYVMIHCQGHQYTCSGLFKSRIDSTFILNPHQGCDYSSGKPIYKLINGDEIGNLNGAIITELSLENLLGYCEINNKEIEKSNKSKD